MLQHTSSILIADFPWYRCCSARDRKWHCHGLYGYRWWHRCLFQYPYFVPHLWILWERTRQTVNESLLMHTTWSFWDRDDWFLNWKLNMGIKCRIVTSMERIWILYILRWGPAYWDPSAFCSRLMFVPQMILKNPQFGEGHLQMRENPSNFIMASMTLKRVFMLRCGFAVRFGR